MGRHDREEKEMNLRDPSKTGMTSEGMSVPRAVDLLKEAFVRISIPVLAFAFTYLALDGFLRIFLG